MIQGFYKLGVWLGNGTIFEETQKLVTRREWFRYQKPRGCKTLWFAGFYDGNVGIDKYAYFYSVALLSAQEKAPGLLQPVLLVGHLEENRNNTTPEIQRTKEQFYKWVESKGGIVIHKDRLSFQDVINKHYNNDPPSHRQGPFFRLDIPNIIDEHKLFDRDGICQHNDVVLYTDCDVLFTNITISTLEITKNMVSSQNKNTKAIITYGPESHKSRKTCTNTGVMFFSSLQFGARINEILEFGANHSFDFSAYDQGLLNAYFRQNGLCTFLRPAWNYKAYWGDADESDIWLIHFHGPKPDGRTLDCLASGNLNSTTCSGKDGAPYENLVRKGLDADGGHLANKTLMKIYGYTELYDKGWKP